MSVSLTNFSKIANLKAEIIIGGWFELFDVAGQIWTTINAFFYFVDESEAIGSHWTAIITRRLKEKKIKRVFSHCFAPSTPNESDAEICTGTLAGEASLERMLTFR